MSDSRNRKDVDGESSSSNKNIEWEDVKKARNRINSQRTRERERLQMETLEADKTRLSLSNDALRFQNEHFREGIQQIREVQRLRRMNAAVAGGESIGGTGSVSGLSRPGGAASDMLDAARGQSVLEHNAFLPSLQQQMRYSGLDLELGQLSSRMPPIGPIGGTTLDDLRIRQQAARDVEAALLQRHRAAAAAAAGIGGLHPMTQSTLGMTRPTGVLQVPSSQEIMELRARQLRMQELNGMGGAAGMLGQLPRGFRGSTLDSPEAVMVRNLREDSKQEAKQIDRMERREKTDR